MKIYTRTGDKGITSLVYGARVSKDSLRVEAYGACDEANSMIGFASSFISELNWNEKSGFIEKLHHVQTALFHVGAELSTPHDREVVWKLKEAHIHQLEKQIDEWDNELPELNQFILPGGHKASSALHVARTSVRRAERKAVALADELISEHVVAYLNRLSDYLFVGARYINYHSGEKEITLHQEEES